MTFRFFVNSNEINWQEKNASISDNDHTYKISRVLRLKENDQIILLDGNGLVYNAQIISFYSRKIQCKLLSRRSVNTEPNLKIIIAQSLLKGPKFDYALQKNTEIGVYEFIPVTSQRSVIRFEENGISHEVDKKINRFQKIVRDAAEQSERGIVPLVKDLLSVQELCKQNLTGYDLKLICQERAQNTSGIKELLNGIQVKVQKVFVLIGPEGGFTEEESRLAISSGFIPVSLGKRIYKAETVGTVISSILFFYFNDLQ